MTIRWMLALCAALVSATASIAQPPTPVPFNAPTPFIGGPVGGALPPPSPGGDGVGAAEGPEIWASMEYLLGWVYGSNLLPVVTTSPAGTPRVVAGVLGGSAASTIYGGGIYNDRVRSGVRVQAGTLLDAEWGLNVEAGFSVLESQADIFSRSSNGTPILARPFVSTLTNTFQSVLVAFPDSSAGKLDIRVSSGNFYEFHLDLSEVFVDDGWFRLDGLFGYRFYRYDEGLRFRQYVYPTQRNFVPGTAIGTADDFSTRNEFHGPEMGVRTRIGWNDLYVNLLAKVAIGQLWRDMKISGNTATSVPGVDPVVSRGGFYALSSNIGTYKLSNMTVVPELGATIAYQILPSCRLTMGYSVLMLDRVARANDLLDLLVNPTLVPGQPNQGRVSIDRPAYDLRLEEMWVQSLSFGMEFTY